MSTDNKTTSDHALRVATAYHEAWTSGDLDKAMSFMTDDVVVHAARLGHVRLGRAVARGEMRES